MLYIEIQNSDDELVVEMFWVAILNIDLEWKVEAYLQMFFCME